MFAVVVVASSSAWSVFAWRAENCLYCLPSMNGRAPKYAVFASCANKSEIS